MLNWASLAKTLSRQEASAATFRWCMEVLRRSFCTALILLKHLESSRTPCNPTGDHGWPIMNFNPTRKDSEDRSDPVGDLVVQELSANGQDFLKYEGLCLGSCFRGTDNDL
jgi:hypothetical protein